VRLLLTGYSDLAAIVGSVNEGEVFRFVSKPWDNQEIQDIVGEAVAIALELGQRTSTPPIVPETMEAGVLVIDAHPEMVENVSQMLGGACPIHRVNNLDEAVGALDARETALIIADIASSGDEALAAFKVLKHERPEILVIMLAQSSDAELVINLINQAQIFRFITKPVNPDLLRQHIQGALTRYQSFKQNPHLTQQHRVAAPEAGSSVGEKIMSRVKSLKNWF